MNIKSILKNGVLVFACICFILVLYYCTDPLIDAPKGYYGVPAVSTNYPQLNMNIQQVVDDGDRIYVLFNSNKRIVQVYDMDGAYQNTLFFYSHYDNGAFSIVANDGVLYVRDEPGNIYVFRNGTFSEFYQEKEIPAYLDSVKFDWRISSEAYEVRDRSVWKVSQEEEVCIIDMEANAPSKKHHVYLFALFIPLFILLINFKRKGSQ